MLVGYVLRVRQVAEQFAEYPILVMASDDGIGWNGQFQYRVGPAEDVCYDEARFLNVDKRETGSYMKQGMVEA
jgi:hypothetical protein